MDVKLPKLGEGADSGVVVSLSVKVGDTVSKGQTLLELENEKAVAAVPSDQAGTVSQIHVKVGDKVSVGQRLVSLKEAGQAPAAPAPQPSASAPRPSRGPRSEPAQAPPTAAEPEPDEVEEAPPHRAGVAPAASPSLRRLAKDLGIDLARIRGSEHGGRIVMADLRAYIARLQKLAARSTAAPAQPAPPAVEPVDFSRWGPVTVKPLSPLRQVIARRMGASWTHVPRVTQFDEADVTGLLALRKEHQAAFEKQGTRLTLTAFLLKAVADVLQKHPVVNASLDASGEQLVLKSYYHIGVAVDTEAGLLVPVLRDVDKLSLLELSRALEELAQKARERKLSADDMKGGTFTVSNQGGIGGAQFTPVVNLPEVAILGLGRGAVKPVWRDGQVQPRTLLPLALSYDHRVIDGANAARFVVDLVQAIEGFDPKRVEG
ncbi:MAG: biotin/lipoyl-binding protein [Verrucomicrobia bacterium]|nr:biotin/lipoyl-binding protein [Verrucomicrobiota bacterium]